MSATSRRQRSTARSGAPSARRRPAIGGNARRNAHHALLKHGSSRTTRLRKHSPLTRRDARAFVKPSSLIAVAAGAATTRILLTNPHHVAACKRRGARLSPRVLLTRHHCHLLDSSAPAFRSASRSGCAIRTSCARAARRAHGDDVFWPADSEQARSDGEIQRPRSALHALRKHIGVQGIRGQVLESC